MPNKPAGRSVGLTIIAVGKAIQVLLVVFVAAAALLFVDRVPAAKLVTVVLNAAVVAYLAGRLLRARRQKHAPEEA